MWNHITQTLQLVSLARGLMSLWKCATHSSLGNFSCTDEREGERCGYANSVEMARRPRETQGLYRQALSDGATSTLDFYGGASFRDRPLHLFNIGGFGEAAPRCWCISRSRYGADLLISVLWGQRVRVWIDSWGQNAVTTQWKATKELISNQLPTCFFPAPFICFECWAG